MGEAFIVRKGGVTSEETAAPTITIVSETGTDVTFTLTNNDDNTALITHEVDDNIGAVELAAAATSSNITVALDAGTYTLTAFATVVGEVATQSTSAVEIVAIPAYEELFELDVTTATTQINITSLSIGKDDTLRLVYTFPAAQNNSLLLFANGNTTASNYHSQRLIGTGSSLIALRVNSPIFGNNATRVSGYIDIKVSNNDKFVAQVYDVEGIGLNSSGITNRNANIVGSGFTATSITSLTVFSTVTNNIAVGSKIALYKVTEAA